MFCYGFQCKIYRKYTLIGVFPHNILDDMAISPLRLTGEFYTDKPKLSGRYLRTVVITATNLCLSPLWEVQHSNHLEATRVGSPCLHFLCLCTCLETESAADSTALSWPLHSLTYNEYCLFMQFTLSVYP